MTGPAVVILLAFCAAAIVATALVGSDLIKEALDEMEARREWRRIVELSEKRQHLSNTSPRSLP